MSSPAARAAAEVLITFPDGRVQGYPSGTTALQIAQSISSGLAQKVVAAIVNDAQRDLDWPIETDVTLKLIKRDDPEALFLIRHDCAHVLAEAVQTLFPGTQVTIGPNIENGFFYDFYRPGQPFTTEDLPVIEKKMHEIIARSAAFTREVWPRDKAIQYFMDKGELFKAEIIRDLPETEDISIYRQGEWLDLCRGPHMPTTKSVGGAFKLMKVAGAYWRGDSNREMLTRIYGTAWHNDKDLQAYLTQIEEAEKRDHRKLGKELDLYHFQDEAQGSVFWHEKGFRIWKVLENYIRHRQDQYGYSEVKTPQLLDTRFWEASGHWGKYRENMFVVPDIVPNTEEGEKLFKEEPKHFMALKPMNCPGHVQIFKQGIKSYRDLPIRFSEFGCCHRNEAHGALHGLLRVRQMTQDDGHIFCREDQLLEETKLFMDMFVSTYKDFGFEDVLLKIATRPEQRAGSDETWDKAEKALIDAVTQLGREFTLAPGEGAFYGPKLEFHVRDAIGRSWQCATLQIDFIMPQRLEATYIGSDGQKHYPVMLHRAVYGSFERFAGMLIEGYAGKLPLWLAPTQVVVATITNAADSYATKIYEQMKAAGIRAELDIRSEKINLKIREHSLQKVHYMLIAGAKESEAETVTIRQLGIEAQETKPFTQALAEIKQACQPPF